MVLCTPYLVITTIDFFFFFTTSQIYAINRMNIFTKYLGIGKLFLGLNPSNLDLLNTITMSGPNFVLNEV